MSSMLLPLISYWSSEIRSASSFLPCSDNRIVVMDLLKVAKSNNVPLFLKLFPQLHHYQAQNIEQIVACLLDMNMLAGFHFNDRRDADDDLTMGSIDAYHVFRIFHEIAHFEWETGKRADIAYMIDQSHNLKGKIEAMIQTVTTAMELFAKAALVNHEKLAGYQTSCALVDAETCLKDAFSTDVRPVIREWAVSKGLPADAMDAFRQSGYLEKITADRGAKNMAAVSSYA